jgi:3-oxoacyl-[acyl-carrier protein] reductase
MAFASSLKVPSAHSLKEIAVRKSAIVIGGSRGIGRSIALRLAADRFAVAISYAENTEAADEVLNEIRHVGGEAISVKGEVSDLASVGELFATTLMSFGRIDVVVNIMGTMPLTPIAKGDVDTFDKVIRTNLRGTYLVFSHASERIADGGRIIAFSGSAPRKSILGYEPYVAAKAGIEGLVRVFANEMRGRSVTVNAVSPGPTGTELFLNQKSEDDIAQPTTPAPLEGRGTPEDIASLVSFLAGPESGWINGQVLRSNGGVA